MWPLALLGLSGAAQSYMSSRDARKAAEMKKFKTLEGGQRRFVRDVRKSFDPEQLNLLNDPNYQAGSSYLQRLLSDDPEAFESFESPYKTQFQEEIVPQLAERFSSMGARNSSAFNNALAREGSNLSQRLASLRENLRMNALQSALGYSEAQGRQALAGSQMGLTPLFGYTTRGGGGGIGSALGQGAASGLNMYALMNMLGSGGTPSYGRQTWSN